jgi:hypothetical protein
MRHRLQLASALIAISLVGGTASASAQGAGAGAQIGATPGTGTVPPVGTPNTGSAGVTSAPGGSSTTTTGMGTGSSKAVNPTHNQPGVPDTSPPGRFGTMPSQGGLPGDNPNPPGLSGRIGQ